MDVLATLPAVPLICDERLARAVRSLGVAADAVLHLLDEVVEVGVDPRRTRWGHGARPRLTPHVQCG